MMIAQCEWNCIYDNSLLMYHPPFCKIDLNCPFNHVICSVQEKYEECKINPKGIGYLGSASQSIKGEPCLEWTSFPDDPNVAMLPDLKTTDAQNFCRNILGNQTWNVPSCLVAMGVDQQIQIQPCGIPYCGNWSKITIFVNFQECWSECYSTEFMEFCLMHLHLPIGVESFLQHNFCGKPYVPSRELRRDTSNRRLNEHG